MLYLGTFVFLHCSMLIMLSCPIALVHSIAAVAFFVSSATQTRPSSLTQTETVSLVLQVMGYTDVLGLLTEVQPQLSLFQRSKLCHLVG